MAPGTGARPALALAAVLAAACCPGATSTGTGWPPPAAVFPMGWFSSAVMGTGESLPPAPFTTVVKYFNENPPENSTGAVRRYLDSASAAGVSVVLELPHRWVAARPKPALAPIRALVTAVCAHPALLGWYMVDEPDKQRSWVSPVALAAVAAAVRAAEAGSPGTGGCAGRHLPISAAFATLQQPGNASKAGDYNRSVNTYMFDDYPCRCSPGWHSRPLPAFGGPDFARFPAAMRQVGGAIAPAFDSFWAVLQGSIIDSAYDHGHYCNATKCWSAGWRLCSAAELRYQVFAALLAGARGLLFYRLGILHSPVDMDYVSRTMVPVLQDVAEQLPAVLAGPIGLTSVANTSSAQARQYRCPAEMACEYVVLALRWAGSAAQSNDSLPIGLSLGEHATGAVAVRLGGAGGAVAKELTVGRGGMLEDSLEQLGAVAVYRILSLVPVGPADGLGIIKSDDSDAGPSPAVDPLACGVMCGNVTTTNAVWQLCVPGFFQWSLNRSSGVDLASAPLNLKRMKAAGVSGASFAVPQLVNGQHYQLFYRQSKSTAQGESWSFWQRLTPAPPNMSHFSAPAETGASGPVCGPVCGDVRFSAAETAAGRSGFQPFCQAGMLKGELALFGVEIGPSSETGLRFPFHLQQLLKMQPGTFSPVESVLLRSGQQKNGRMLFRQGLHANGWVAIFQQRFVTADDESDALPPAPPGPADAPAPPVWHQPARCEEGDVNALFQFKGVWHLLQQWHLRPHTAIGHAVSRDLLHWERVSDVLASGADADEQCYDGSASIVKKGPDVTPILQIDGGCGHKQAGTVQCMESSGNGSTGGVTAFPDDLDDPNLEHWSKAPGPTIWHGCDNSAGPSPIWQNPHTKRQECIAIHSSGEARFVATDATLTRWKMADPAFLKNHGGGGGLWKRLPPNVEGVHGGRWPTNIFQSNHAMGDGRRMCENVVPGPIAALCYVLLFSFANNPPCAQPNLSWGSTIGHTKLL
eukprot:SAG22_NODE_264_length_13353_cov_34.575298_1_plen_978_part_00